MIRERIREKLHEKKVMKVLHLKNKKEGPPVQEVHAHQAVPGRR
jgi:hypothetical protein